MRASNVITATCLSLAAFAALSDEAGFLKTLAESNRAEIQAGEIAVSKASSDSVRAFGTMLVEDHGGALDKVEALAKSKDIALPDALSKEKTDMLAKLRQRDASRFDPEFMAEMVKAHEKSVSLLQSELVKGSPETTALARQLLPTVQSHLREAYRLTGQADEAAAVSTAEN